MKYTGDDKPGALKTTFFSGVRRFFGKIMPSAGLKGYIAAFVFVAFNLKLAADSKLFVSDFDPFKQVLVLIIRVSILLII